MKQVKIMRGIPGSGKSHTAIQMLLKANKEGMTTAKCSADDFFMKSGEYKFNPSSIGQAHLECMQNFLASIKNELDYIVVDNTNTQVWEYTPYMQVAQASDYEVEIIEVEAPFEVCLERQTHGVPEEHLKSMKDRFKKVLFHHRSMVKLIKNY